MFGAPSAATGIVLVILVFATSVLFTMLGLGGGVVYIPLQVFLGIDYHRAAATSLFLVILNSLSATVVYARANRIDWQLVGIVEVATVIGGFFGGLFSGFLSEFSLSVIFCLLVSTAGLVMLKEQRQRTEPISKGVWCWHRTWRESTYQVPLLVVLPSALVIGLLSNLAGLGGGVLLVPLLTIAGGIPMHVAVGSSACMVGITALAGFLGHIISGHFELRSALILGVAVIIGSQLGARISATIHKRTLRRIFAWSSIGIGMLMLLRGLTR